MGVKRTYLSLLVMRVWYCLWCISSACRWTHVGTQYEQKQLIGLSSNIWKTNHQNFSAESTTPSFYFLAMDAIEFPTKDLGWYFSSSLPPCPPFCKQTQELGLSLSVSVVIINVCCRHLSCRLSPRRLSPTTPDCPICFISRLFLLLSDIFLPIFFIFWCSLHLMTPS